MFIEDNDEVYLLQMHYAYGVYKAFSVYWKIKIPKIKVTKNGKMTAKNTTHNRLMYVSNTVLMTHTRPFNGPLSGTTLVSWYQEGKTNLDFSLKQGRVSGSGISWAECKSAPHSRQITTPAPHHSDFFTGRMPFLLPNQQRQSTEGNAV